MEAKLGRILDLIMFAMDCVVMARPGANTAPAECGITSWLGGMYLPSIIDLLRAAIPFCQSAPRLSGSTCVRDVIINVQAEAIRISQVGAIMLSVSLFTVTELHGGGSWSRGNCLEYCPIA